MGKLRNFTLDTSGLESLMERIEEMGKDVDAALVKGLEEVSKKVATDTEAALDTRYLPARGKYSIGKTKESIVRDAQVQKDGLGYYINIGFDFAKDGAGGFLIKGTPKMSPDPQLRKMFYKGSKYMHDLEKALWAAVAMTLYE